ncbi:MAG: dTMP kinase [Candidatus Bathyarchaeota archaeon]|nr:dTMP kinase [Candidatus Bathyarchaeota archaeon]MDH5687034.1 dTMP kinase [Candidatus Bathyarchaeota archaeon]
MDSFKGKPKGMFVVFEGPHASGKTKQSKMLNESLRDKGIKSHYTKEPYCDDFVPLIKMCSKRELINSPVLMYLLAADRYIHVQDIKSWLENGIIVVCDRYVLSSWVYQQIQGIPLSIITRTNYFAINPHLTFYFDVPFAERLARVRRTHTVPPTYFLTEDKLIEEQELYQRLISNWDEGSYGKIAVIDGQQDIMKIHRIIEDLVIGELK